MPWFKVDDAFYRHKKVRRLGRDRVPAIGLWVMAGAWCADNLTDGFVPTEQVEMWDPRLRYAQRLVDERLWTVIEQEGEQGYQFEHWHLYQPTRASIEAEREEWRAKKKAQRRGGRRAGASPEVSPGDTPGDTPGDSPEKQPGNPQESPSGSPPGFPDPVPGPVPVPGSSHLGRGPHEGNARASPPPRKCAKHANDPNPPPCGRCADARRAAEAWHGEQAANGAQEPPSTGSARVDKARGFLAQDDPARAMFGLPVIPPAIEGGQSP